MKSIRRNVSSKSRSQLVPSASPSQDKACESIFPIVGIGASAGGLEAIIKLLQALPTDSGMAFVLIQHLDPHHESILADLLSKVTKMKICQAQEGMPVEVNCGYVISPTMDLTLVDSVLALSPRPQGGTPHLPIDLFFRSLAEAQADRAVGVVLSGVGSDGALGLEAIHSQGGTTLVQDPESAKYDGMPRSAIATGCVDLVLSPEGLAQELVRISHDPYVRSSLDKAAPAEEGILPDEGLGKILAVLRTQRGIDFKCYKRGTIQRRIQRRMLLRKIVQTGDYLTCLNDDPVEVENLCNDLLIQVTRFFRDPETYEILKDKIFPELFKQKAPDDPFRLWVAGCSSGEEVYSMAICLLEYLGEKTGRVPIQIFGTDINEKAIEKARSGTYLQNIEIDVSAERLGRFFTKSSSYYQINTSLRNLCVFASQNILKDPPFSKLDLVSCRNVMIYLEPVLQKRVLSIFHFALNPGGRLVVGSAESPRLSTDLFFPIDSKHNIYAKKPGPSKPIFDFALSPYSASLRGDPVSPKSETGISHVQQEANRVLLAQYVPAGVIIDENLDVVEYRGDTRLFLQNMPGEPSRKLLRMARDEIAAGLSEALRKGKKTPFRKGGMSIDVGGQVMDVSIEVIPLRVPHSEEQHWAVMFKAEPSSVPAPEKASRKQTKTGRRLKESSVDHWKKELASTQAYLHSVVEEKAAALEEMQSANEEVLSSNEELQSINEELQTAKEELQATNEELTTINEQLGRSNHETVAQMNDLNNLVDSTRVAIIMVGADLRIRRFTPYAEKMLHLIPADIGRLVGDITPRINISDLENRILGAIASGSVQEDNVQDKNGCWYSLRIHPYITLEKKIDGAVVVLVDVDALKRSEMAVTEARDYAEDVLATIHELFLVLDAELRVTHANLAFYRMFQMSPNDVVGRFLVDLGNGQWNIPDLPKNLQRALHENVAIYNLEVTHDFATLGCRTLMLNSSVISRHGKGADMILLAMEDITEKKQAMEKVRSLNAELEERVYQRTKDLEAANSELESFSYSVAHDLREPLRGASGFAQVLMEDYGEALDARGKKYLERIAVASQRMGQMIDDLLSLSSLTRERMKRDKVDLSQLAESIAADLQNSQPGRQVQFEIAPGLEANGDRNLLRIMLTNLLGNAWKFTSKRPTARIEVGRDTTMPEEVFFVRDDGVGFDMAYVDQLFKVFKRLHASEDYSGTGIGLAMVQRIIRLHGGNIWAKGTLNRGATFYFTLAPSATDSKRFLSLS